MKFPFIAILLFFLSGQVIAQRPTIVQLQDSAKLLMQQGDVDDALQLLQLAGRQSPNNAEILRDISFAAYLKRDFVLAMGAGKQAIEQPAADAQAYQVLGLSYKATANYKECEKLYKEGLKKFPASGVLYNEYAELLAMNSKMDEAVMIWESGIKADPGYSSNYYNMTMYYQRTGNWLRAMVYGELFLNIESYTQRTTDIKKAILSANRNCFSKEYIRQAVNVKTATAFEKDMLSILNKAADDVKDGPEIDMLGAARTRFLTAWMDTFSKAYPFRLFDHQQYLIKQGLFEAYNQWLFGPAIDTIAYSLWQTNHPKEAAAFRRFQEGRVFKVPPGQYYFAN